MDKEHLQEELESEIHDEKSNETQPVTHDNANPEENPSESASEPEPHPQENNGEVTLRDVVEVLKEGFSSLSNKLDEGFSSISRKLNKLDDISSKLDSIDGTLKNLRGDITEMSLYSLLTDYMIEKKMHKEFKLLDAPRKVERGEADFVLLADGKIIYIVEIKTSVSKSNVGQLGKKLASKYDSLRKRIKDIDNYETRGVIAARYVMANINPDEVGNKFPYPVYIFTFVPDKRGYALLTLEEFAHEKEGNH